ncbi:MAG TPA: class I SAM-dependent methyltransferase [Geobacteraceae bacterium]
MSKELRGAVPLSHFFLRERVGPGDAVVDATCGNGRDTLLLAELVGPAGRVWSFDIQEEALRKTAALLEEKGVRDRVELVAAGHERLAEFVGEPLRTVVFNLGYLPGGDRGMATQPATTRPALDAALGLLLPGGLLLVAVYTGHPGAVEEEDAVLAWACGLDPRRFNVWVSRQLNRPPTAPYLVLVEKGGRGEKEDG